MWFRIIHYYSGFVSQSRSAAAKKAEVQYLGFETVPNTNTLALKTEYTPEVYPNPNGEYPTTTKPE